MRIRVSFFLLSFALACVASAAAQQPEKGYWRAASRTAQSITGDISFPNSKITINFASFPIAYIRTLQPAEVATVFDADANSAGNGAIYRLNIPAAQRFLNKNTLCGSEQAQWMATWVSGKTLSVAFFSGDSIPVFSFEAINKSTNLCGIFLYSR